MVQKLYHFVMSGYVSEIIFVSTPVTKAQN